MEAANTMADCGFRTIRLQQLDIVTEEALRAGQYCLVVDKTEKAAIYFTYKATLKEFGRDILAVRMGRKDKREAAEVLRKSLVYCMRAGDRFVIYLDKMTCDLKQEYNIPDHFPTEEIFDFDKWRGNDHYMCVVKTEENHDNENVQGQYFMNSNFQMIVLLTYTSEEDAVNMMKNIPHSDKMAKYVIVDNPS